MMAVGQRIGMPFAICTLHSPGGHWEGIQQGATMQVATESYALQQLVLHADSETLIDGKRAPLEVRCCSVCRGL